MADFNESDHPRAQDGKFTSGGDSGASARAVRNEDRVREARAIAGARADDAEHELRTRIAGEESAHAAGHVPAVPDAKFREYQDIRAKADAEIDALHADLDGAQRDALRSAHELDALDLRERDEPLVGASDLADIYGDSATDLGNEEADYSAIGEGIQSHGEIDSGDLEIDERGKVVPYERTEYEPDPRLSAEANEADLAELNAEQDEIEAEYKADAERYTSARAARKEAISVKANETQDKLEALHAKQVAALDRLKALSKHERRAARASEDEADFEPDVEHFPAFKDHEIDDETGQFADPHVQQSFEHAYNAYSADLEHSQRQRDSASDRFRGEFAQESLSESVKATASALRSLAKITRRQPKLAKPAKPANPTKKRNRPDDAGGRIVKGMSRYKLKLSKLDFVSLVDTPAQETATLRLLKRKGGDRVQASLTARLAKISDGDSPLAYFWAFTCTDEKGQPYHDLQGDAITDFVKAAEEFMRDSAASDEMHDGKQTSRVAFAFPMDADIAAGMFGKTIGDQIKTSGLMVAIRPNPEALSKLRSGEYTGVSIAGTGIREVAKAGGRRRLSNQVVLTSVVDGHQHQINLDDPVEGYSDELTTSYATAEGSENGHSHAWIYDPDTGAITIAQDSGHTHTVDATVPDSIRQRAAQEEQQEELTGGSPTLAYVSARAGSGISTPSEPTLTVKGESKEHSAMADQKDQIAELEKRNARLEKMATLTDAQRAHFSKLSGSEAEAFLSKSSHERDIVLSEIAKADEIVYTSKTTGAVFRKSDDLRMIEMAKRLDDATAAQQAAEIEKRELEFAKRGEETLSHFHKGAKGNLRGRIMKALNTEFVNADEYAEAVAALKGANFALRDLTVAKGVNPQIDPNQPETPAARLEKLAQDYAKTNNVPYAKAYGAVLDTHEGAALYSQIPVGRA
ncbi:MAG TPA: hypothetical protein VFT22_07320 [Kofleriaceae bacterium]|nr:hypothetical protein [Kofleriaceae bacterium]